MKNISIKLEEYMYISLIGKFYSTEVVNNIKFVSFIDDSKKFASPIYLTNSEIVSRKVLVNRAQSFEQKSLKNEELLNKIQSQGSEYEPNYVGRIKTYLASLTEDEMKATLNKLSQNLESLLKEDFIEEDEKILIQKYVEKVCSELNKNIKNEITKKDNENELNIF